MFAVMFHQLNVNFVVKLVGGIDCFSSSVECCNGYEIIILILRIPTYFITNTIHLITSPAKTIRRNLTFETQIAR